MEVPRRRITYACSDLVCDDVETLAPGSRQKSSTRVVGFGSTNVGIEKHDFAKIVQVANRKAFVVREM